MRVVRNPQLQIGEVATADIRFDPQSRADIPRLLRGLQHLYKKAGKWLDPPLAAATTPAGAQK